MACLARLVSVIALTALFAAIPVLRTAAQDGTPALGTSGTISVAETHAVIDAYLTALVAREDIAPFFSDDVVLELVDVGQHIQGREAVADAIVGLHQQAFDAHPQITNLIASEGTAAVEAVFIGTHTGEFVGIPATGRDVAVPYAVFYDLADGEITALRIHGFATGMVAALTAVASPAAGTPTVGVASEALSVTLNDIYFEPAWLEIPADTDVTITLINTGTGSHTFSINSLGPGHTGVGPFLLAGQTREVTLNAAPGEYEFYCQIPGHKDAGMVGTLVVR